jgi:protein-tyrosine phosphatase
MSNLISLPGPPTKIFDRLLLGTLWDAKQLDEYEHSVGFVVNCTDETIHRSRYLDTIQLGIIDGKPVHFGKIEQAIQGLHRFFASTHKHSVLVCCHASVSRSPAIVLAYLMSTGMNFDEAISLLWKKHPQTNIAPSVMKSVRQYFGIEA